MIGEHWSSPAAEGKIASVLYREGERHLESAVKVGVEVFPVPDSGAVLAV